MKSVPSFQEIRNQALDLGWVDVGITHAKIPECDIQAYEEWLKENNHADLKYMENKLRCHPDELFPGAKSVIIFVSYYKQDPVPFEEGRGVVASYARGRDYHNIHHSRLKKMIRWLEERTGQANIAKGFSDSTPILEKALAVQAGLGWFGKNTLLIHRKYGTFTLLAGLLTTLQLEPSNTLDLRLPKCGTCTKCIDACPTNALTPYQLNATRCLSYHLIESKGPLPNEIQEKNPGYGFGCDICQDVCPHNVRKPCVDEGPFTSESGLGAYLDEQKLSRLTQEDLYGTPLKRRGLEGLRLNLKNAERPTEGTVQRKS